MHSIVHSMPFQFKRIDETFLKKLFELVQQIIDISFIDENRKVISYFILLSGKTHVKSYYFNFFIHFVWVTTHVINHWRLLTFDRKVVSKLHRSLPLLESTIIRRY